MSQHVPETCNESNGLWLPLIEYSVRSGVSLSTIRRKIKNNSIQYRLDKGRYLILFSERNNQSARAGSEPVRAPVEAPRPQAVARPIPVAIPQAPAPSSVSEEERWSPLVERSVKMVSDAFEHALREKDERIRLLERSNQELQEQLNELRLLVRVLEEKYEVRY